MGICIPLPVGRPAPVRSLPSLSVLLALGSQQLVVAQADVGGSAVLLFFCLE